MLFYELYKSLCPQAVPIYVKITSRSKNKSLQSLATLVKFLVVGGKTRTYDHRFMSTKLILLPIPYIPFHFLLSIHLTLFPFLSANSISAIVLSPTYPSTFTTKISSANSILLNCSNFSLFTSSSEISQSFITI